jgi:hypothetical protein
LATLLQTQCFFERVVIPFVEVENMKVCFDIAVVVAQLEIFIE